MVNTVLDVYCVCFGFIIELLDLPLSLFIFTICAQSKLSPSHDTPKILEKLHSFDVFHYLNFIIMQYKTHQKTQIHNFHAHIYNNDHETVPQNKAFERDEF